MDKATYRTYKGKFVLDTKNYCLKIQTNFESENSLKLKVFSDSDWAGNPETKVSVRDFTVYL